MTLDPDVLLMDEPFSALDAPTSDRLQELVLMLKRESDLTTVIVTHRIEEAVRMGDRILVLARETNRKPRLMDNPCSAETDVMKDAAFSRQCADIRTLLEDLT